MSHRGVAYILSPPTRLFGALFVATKSSRGSVLGALRAVNGRLDRRPVKSIRGRFRPLHYRLLPPPKGIFREIMCGRSLVAYGHIEEIHGNQIQLLVDAANACLAINPSNPFAVAQNAAEYVSRVKELVKGLSMASSKASPREGGSFNNVLADAAGTLQVMLTRRRCWLGRHAGDLGVDEPDRYVAGVAAEPSKAFPMYRAGIGHGECMVADTYHVRGRIDAMEWLFLAQAANACLDINSRNPLTAAERLPKLFRQARSLTRTAGTLAKKKPFGAGVTVALSGLDEATSRLVQVDGPWRPRRR